MPSTINCFGSKRNSVKSSVFAIRKMEESDLDDVVRMEGELFSMPFSRALFRKFMAQDAIKNWVIVAGGGVVGYLIHSLLPGQIDILNIAIEKKWQRRGAGSKLMQHLFLLVTEHGVEEIFLEVRPSNKAARAFYEKWGFFEVSRRKGYYHDTGEDALILRLKVKG